MRRIRELFADFIAVLHDNSVSSDMLHSHDCGHCAAANRSSLSGGGAVEEKASVTLPGTVDKIIPPIRPGAVEKAQISVEGAEPLYQEIRIENSLQSPDGVQVRLKKGAEVDVTVEAPENAVTKSEPGEN